MTELYRESETGIWDNLAINVFQRFYISFYFICLSKTGASTTSVGVMLIML